MFHMLYSPYWWVTLPGLALGLYAQFKLSSTYHRYNQVGNEAGISGEQAARAILNQSGLGEIGVAEIEGHLTDHFDPVKRTLFLSSENFQGRSLSAIGVAAHEAGHALQQQAAYALFNFRMWMVPATRFASFGYFGIFFLGFFLGGAMFSKLLLAAIALFSIITLFQVVTLPVEYDASRRAKQKLLQLGLVKPDEAPAINSVLNAAALTYVAAMLTSVLQLLELVALLNGRNRD